MDSENSKTSDSHRLVPSLGDKMNLERNDKHIS